ncbi:tubulin polyglutamylase complex subunit 2-like [Plakobranchus ocellatus]|uniref:Tubulin polyglutamylase complex subunit 2-like n=1 Tax=Plakobranchus ocellatus TaxID=259542 RepID=A0AAV4C8C2_9GAST|nr:tubulin polyglutamylase complex subunit 2-like [Plakobranchus ocellatus]
MDGVKPKNLLEKMTICIVSYLEKKTGVCQVKNDVKAPAERAAILMWEQKHSLLMPEDLKNFFMTSNGFHLTWSVKMENSTIPVGAMQLNSVGQMLRLENGSGEGTHVQPSLWDLDMDNEISGRKAPSFVDSRIFELDPCDGNGKVCLVFNEVQQDFMTEIWYLDRSLRWHYICDSFLAYFRLMLMHLGLPHWQLAFTDIGLPPLSKQWFNMYAPIRLEVDIEGMIDPAQPTEVPTASPLDPNKIFKGKSDRKKITNPQSSAGALSQSAAAAAKRKFPVTSARSANSTGKQTSSNNPQMPMKSSR